MDAERQALANFSQPPLDIVRLFFRVPVVHERELPAIAAKAQRPQRLEESLEIGLALRDGEDSNRPGGRTSSKDHGRSEEHTSELQSLAYLVCRLLLEKKKRRRG